MILLNNFECLSTHINDLDILLSPIRTDVRSQIRNMPSVPITIIGIIKKSIELIWWCFNIDT